MANFLITAVFPVDMTVFDLTGTIVGGNLTLVKHTATVLSWTNADGDKMFLRGTGLVPVVVGGVLTDVTAGRITSFELTNRFAHDDVTGLAISAAKFFNLVGANDTLGEAKLLVSGSDHISGTGFADHLLGGAGQDTMIGGGGDDILTGGTGADSFVFDAAFLAGGNTDTISDFRHGQDHMLLDHLIFSHIGAAGALAARHFHAGAAVTAAQHILYDSATGVLSYDADGVGGVAAGAFAQVASGDVVTAADFTVF